MECAGNSTISLEQFAMLRDPMQSWGENCRSGATAMQSCNSEDKVGIVCRLVTKLEKDLLLVKIVLED